MIQGSNSVRGKKYFCLPKHPDQLGQPSSLFSMYISSSPEVKQPEHKVQQSPPSSSEVKNEYSYACTPPLCCHCV